MIGWCEIEDSDAADKPVDLYMTWMADSPKVFMWLCREHAALLTVPQEGQDRRGN